MGSATRTCPASRRAVSLNIGARQGHGDVIRLAIIGTGAIVNVTLLCYEFSGRRRRIAATVSTTAVRPGNRSAHHLSEAHRNP